MAAKRPTTFSMRMPEDLNERIQAYATENNCTKAEAMSHFARAGIELEDSGPEPSPTDHDDKLSKIEERLDALQSLPTIDPAPSTAIVPADIKDKIQTYSSEHDCSEQEALAYYARIGIQVTSDDRPASHAEVVELSRKIDLLAKDSSEKTEQMRQMAEVLVAVRDYTKPDEVELEGEIAEEVEEQELTDEERQRIADEHTRQIVTDVMGTYMTKQQEDQRAREAASAEGEHRASMSAAWIPALVAIIVSLIGLVIVVLILK